MDQIPNSTNPNSDSDGVIDVYKLGYALGLSKHAAPGFLNSIGNAWSGLGAKGQRAIVGGGLGALAGSLFDNTLLGGAVGAGAG